MAPDEVLEALRKIGVNLSRSSLMRYENQRLIPKPQRGGGGPGGRYTNYPQETVAEAYAASALMHGEYIESPSLREQYFDGGKAPKFSPELVAESRIYGVGRSGSNIVVYERPPMSESDDMILTDFSTFGTSAWVCMRNKAIKMLEDAVFKAAIFRINFE